MKIQDRFKVVAKALTGAGYKVFGMTQGESSPVGYRDRKEFKDVKNERVDLYVSPVRDKDGKLIADKKTGLNFAAVSILVDAGVEHDGVCVVGDRLWIRNARLDIKAAALADAGEPPKEKK